LETGAGDTDRIAVRLDVDGASRNVVVDLVVAQTGFRPDPSFHRELQVHRCYASEAPMALAAALLGAGSGDCMSQTSPGPEVLRTSEPGFFLLGNKSYGRNPAFLLRVGREQIRDVYGLVLGDPALDLYADDAGRGSDDTVPLESCPPEGAPRVP
jgi:hypothetical protein